MSRTEACACGGRITAYDMTDAGVFAAVSRHNGTERHRLWSVMDEWTQSHAEGEKVPRGFAFQGSGPRSFDVRVDLSPDCADASAAALEGKVQVRRVP